MGIIQMIRIEAPHFVAAVVLDDFSKVIRAAPIVRYMLGWHMTGVMGYCRKKGWAYELV